MEPWLGLILPFVLILARTAAFFTTLPMFGWQTVPRTVKAGLAVLMAVFFAGIVPPPAISPEVRLLAAVVLIAQEIICGLALGLAINLVFAGIQQGGTIIGRQMGFAEATIIDPSTGEHSRPFGTFLETVFVLLFLGAGGLRLLVRLIGRSYEVFPPGGGVDLGSLAEGLTAAGSAMLLLALKLSAPLLAAFLILAVVLGVLARVLPEMNVLLTSLPLRVGLGLSMAATIVPMLQSFTDELAQWMVRLL